MMYAAGVGASACFLARGTHRHSFDASSAATNVTHASQPLLMGVAEVKETDTYASLCGAPEDPQEHSACPC